MKWRPLNEGDLQLCLEFLPEIDGRRSHEQMLKALRLLLKQPSFHGVVIEVEANPGKPRIVGTGASVFVSEEFALRELATPAKGLTERVLATLLSGSGAILSAAEIARDNSCGGLNVITLWGRWRADIQSAQVIDEIRLQLAMSFASLHDGYLFKRILIHLRDDVDRSFAVATRLCRTAADFGRDALKPSLEEALALIEAQDVNALPGSIIGRHFNRNTPVLGLRRVDQALLLAALDGAPDPEIARRLALGISAVKKRWAALYERLEELNFEPILATELRNDGSRGLQKRHFVLAYMREHAEELRPFRSAKRI